MEKMVMETLRNIKLGRTDSPEQRIPAVGFLIARAVGLDQEVVTAALTAAAGLEEWEIPENASESFKQIRLPATWMNSEERVMGMWNFCKEDLDKLCAILGYTTEVRGA